LTGIGVPNAPIVLENWLYPVLQMLQHYILIFLMNGLPKEMRMYYCKTYCQTQEKSSGGNASAAIIGKLLSKRGFLAILVRAVKEKRR
jgi:hypothetical protein